MRTPARVMTAASMNVARSGHTAVTLSDGRVLVAGGRAVDGSTLGSAEVYDPATNVWTGTASMAQRRARHTATLLADGRVLMAGGDNNGVPTAGLEIYDSRVRRVQLRRRAHVGAQLVGNQVLVAGGSNGTATLDSTDIVDIATGIVVAGPNMSSPREELTATTLLDWRVLIAGGRDRPTSVAAAETFNGSSFTLTNSLDEPRHGHIATRLPDNNQVLIVGGISGVNDGVTAELHTPWDGTFSATGWSAERHVAATGKALKAEGLFVVAGGNSSSSAELYGFATLKTDKEDYAPAQTVTLTGKGWQPGETVMLLLREDPRVHSEWTFFATADGSGNIENTDCFPEPHHAGVRFYLTAIGLTSQAQTTFTDSPLLRVDLMHPWTNRWDGQLVGAARTKRLRQSRNQRPNRLPPDNVACRAHQRERGRSAGVRWQTVEHDFPPNSIVLEANLNSDANFFLDDDAPNLTFRAHRRTIMCSSDERIPMPLDSARTNGRGLGSMPRRQTSTTKG